ncbi:MAG: histidine kinase [Synechococcaceae cyanobacterium ELA445]
MTTGTGALMALAGILASVLGVQTLVSSAPQPKAVLLLLPNEGLLAGLGDGLRRGYLLAMEQSKACGVSPPELGLGWVRPELDPQPSIEAGPPPSLLIAPPAAPLAPYGLLAERLRFQVLLPLQRGLSLQHLAQQPGSDRLWPVLPARSQAADQLARAVVERRWPPLMVIRDGSAEHRVLAERFVAGLSVAGGRLIGPTNGPIRVDPSEAKAWSQFQDDVDGYRPQALVVFTRPGSPLAQAVAAAPWPQGMALVWPFPPTGPLAQAQLGIGALTQGPGWPSFEAAFRRRWGYGPGVVEAAGFDTGQLTAVAAVPSEPGPSEGAAPSGHGGWDLAWLDPRATPLDLCQALKRRSEGGKLALRGAASKLDLSPAASPTAELPLSDRPPKP